MLQSITWQEFLIASGLLTGLYYVIVLRIISRPHKGGSTISFNPEVPESAVMGGINDDDREDHSPFVASEQISFAGTTPQNSSQSEPVDSMLLGSVSDLLEEAKTLTNFILENKSSKEEATSFLRTLLSKYSQLKDTRYQKAIELYLFNELKDHEGQEMSLDEINAFWN
jgi:hypothetical protein